MSGLYNQNNSGGGGPGPPGASTPYNTIVRSYVPGVSLRDAVYQTGSGTVDKADATSTATMPVVGFVLIMDSPLVGQCMVQIDGDISGFSGLVAGEIYIASRGAGQILYEGAVADPNYPNVHGHVIEQVGIAMSPSTLLIDIQDQEEV